MINSNVLKQGISDLPCANELMSNFCVASLSYKDIHIPRDSLLAFEQKGINAKHQPTTTEEREISNLMSVWL